MSDILKKLNQAQLEAVTHDQGPLLIVAGAGTGKTTVLINRLLYLITEKGIKADEILLTTFTEKATAELVERADKALPLGYVDLWINTFHSFCERLLRQHALDIGLSGDFKLLDQTQQWVLLRKNLDKFNLDYYQPLGNPTKFIHELLRHFSRLKDEDISPADYLEYAEELKQNGDQMLGGLEGKERDLEVQRINELANVYHCYNQLLIENNYLDFGDLIVWALRLFKTRPNILKFYQQKFKYIMVDEFQDTNWAQYELIKLLTSKEANLVVVGDDDQAIYKFRGASLSNIMQFKDDYPRAKEIILNDNYRSGQEILDTAYNFIQHNNPNRLEEKLKISKTLQSNVKQPGIVKHLHFGTETEETVEVAKKIREMQTKKGISWSDFAILVRANDTADKFVKELTRQGIPNTFVSLKGLYYKPIILDAIAYFKLLDNYHESSALFRVLSMDAFRVDPLDIVNINKFARRKLMSTFEVLQNIEAVPTISAKALKNIKKLLALIEKHSGLAKEKKPSLLFVHFINDSGLVKSLDVDKDAQIFSYLNQFYRKIKSFEEVEPDMRFNDFMTRLELELEAGESGKLSLYLDDPEVVKVMTVHAAKGLEFKYVFLVNLVDKRFPTIRHSESISIPDPLVKEQVIEGADVHTEEERRLFYVALTRAKEELYLTSAKDYGGVREKKPSKFLDEAKVLEVQAIEAKQDKNNELLRDLEDFDKEVPLLIPQQLIPVKFSFSQLNTFALCPRQYRYLYILKVPTPPTDSLLFGNLIHNCLQEFLVPVVTGAGQSELFADTKPQADLSSQKLLSIYDSRWFNDGWSTKEERERYRKEGKNNLLAVYQDLAAANFANVKFLEQSFSYRLGNDVIEGRIDRIDDLGDGSVEVIDYKTGKVRDKLDFESKKQLILYQIVVEEVFNLKVGKLSFIYTKDGSRLSFLAKEAEKEKLKLWMREIIDKIKAGDFSAQGDKLICGRCDFNEICAFRKS